MRAVRRSVLTLLAVAALSTAACNDSAGPASGSNITIGGLFSITGNWSTLGATSKAALELAVEDINQLLASGNTGLRFSTEIEDTRLDPTTALAAAQTLHKNGVRIVIGPQSSAEVALLKPYVDTAGLIIASQSSTAGSLAIPNDNILRFTPGDSLEAYALAGLMRADGITNVIPLWRADAGNRGLASATRIRMTALGENVSAGFEYSDTESNFAAALATIKTQVQTAIAASGSAHVAIMLAAFDEAVGIFNAAASDPVLSSVKWYGTDGTALSAAIQSNTSAAAFAAKVGFPTPTFGLDDAIADQWQPIAARIKARAGIDPDAFALAVYDAAWLAAEAYLAAGADADAATLRSHMIAAASNYYGGTGWTALNAAGDRRNGNFDYFSLSLTGGAYQWKRVAQFDTQTGTLKR